MFARGDKKCRRLFANLLPKRSRKRETELVPKSDPRAEIISIDPARMWGTPCFVGTRLPIKSLFDHLESGASLDEFLDYFEGVPRETCIKTLRMAFERLMEGLPNVTSALHTVRPGRVYQIAQAKRP